MATNSRRSRFPDYTGMPNENQNAQSTLTNTLLSRGLQLPGPWNNDAAGGFAKNRDTVTPRDAFNPFSSAGLGTVAAPSADMASWGAGYWNATDPKQTRAVSGSTSPRTRSDASAHDANPFPKFFPGPSTMSQGGPVGSRPATTAALEPSNGTFKYPSGFSDFADEGEGDQFMPQEYERGFPGFSVAAAQRQQAQEQLSLMNAVGSGPRKSVSSRPETDSFNDFTYGAPTAPSMHSQRPSLAGSSFSAQHNMGFDQNAGRQNHNQIVEAFGMMGMGSTANGAANNLQNPLSYDNGSQNFQFNPGSQSWENGQGYGNGHGKDAYANGSGFEKRGSIVGRNSPAGSTYRAGGNLNSPRSFTGTPQPNGDGWSRPTSRDPSLAAELARRGLGEHFVQQPPTPFFANGFYSPNYPQFQSPYAAYGDPRHPAHMGGYGMPVPPYLGAGAVPTRPARDQDPGRAFRSAILHEFKNSPKSRRWELQDIWNHIVEFSGDQQASRFIQGKLETANSDERDQVFAEIEPNAVQLMKDVFGNYVMQKLFEYGDQVQKKVLASAMKGKVVDLSTQAYGCRVVQKALEHVLVEQQVELVKELESDLINVANDQHGNHVVQQAIVLVPRGHLDNIMAGFKGHVCELASHQYGCRVVQRVLEHGSEEDKAAMLLELHNGSQKLLTDMYGNYVIQHVLEKGPPEARRKIISIVTPLLLTLSRHKNASNVVEKCITLGTPQEQRAIRDQLITKGDDANSPLFQLMKDQFGNYVIQRLVKTLQGQDRAVLVDKLASHIQSLKRSGATSKQIEAMELLVADHHLPASTSTSNNPTPASTAPTSPGLRVDVNSAAPTPNLTMDPNSPLSTPSSSLPYLNGDAVEPAANGQPAGKETPPASQPRVGEA